jgi:hypothetical protein
VAVQSGSPLYPLMLVVNGSASDATPDDGDAVPLAQVTLTLTGAALFGTKSFDTTNVAVFSEFTMVHDGAPPTSISTRAQFVWFAV